MYQGLDVAKYEQFFFHGLEAKDTVVKAIILHEAIRMREYLNLGDIDKYEIQEERIKELIVQLKRFSILHDMPNQKYTYHETTIEDKEVDKLYQKNLKELEWKGVCVVRYRPMRGIYFNTRDVKITGQMAYEALGTWATEDVYSLLEHLRQLEKENKFEYYSLFLDTKYARAIDRRQKEITKNDVELKEIEAVYHLFLKSRQISSVDIRLALGNNTSTEIENYISEQYPEYETITTIREKGKKEQYQEEFKKRIGTIQTTEAEIQKRIKREKEKFKEDDKIKQDGIYLDYRYEQRIRQGNIEEQEVLKEVYCLWIRKRKVSSFDLRKHFGEEMPEEIEEYIWRNYPEYESRLKQDALDGEYGKEYWKRVENECSNIQSLVYGEIGTEER